jgi:HD-like signal output (HDOD) protein
MNSLEQIRPRIKSLDAMPAVPAIIQPLATLLQLPSDQVDVERVIELVSYDGTIAAQCLRVANSPLFGRRNTETVRSAVLALGLRRVEAILLGCCLNRILAPNQWALDAVTFWRHSLGCALVSSRMAKLIGYPEPEKAYLAGLLHDLGILVSMLASTDGFRKCIQAARDRHLALHLCEEEHLGFTHCQSGRILAEHWKFSPDLTDVIEFHHAPQSPPAAAPLVALVHLSDLLCRLRDLGYGY